MWIISKSRRDGAKRRRIETGVGGDWRMQKKRDQQRCFNEWKLTHLRKDARGRIYGSPEGRQGQEGALEDRVDKHVKRLSFMCPFLIFRIR